MWRHPGAVDPPSGDGVDPAVEETGAAVEEVGAARQDRGGVEDLAEVGDVTLNR